MIDNVANNLLISIRTKILNFKQKTDNLIQKNNLSDNKLQRVQQLKIYNVL